MTYQENLKKTQEWGEPVLHPDYIYTDRDGDEWEHIDGRWISGDTHAERVATREASLGLETLPDRWGPYTRIEDTNG